MTPGEDGLRGLAGRLSPPRFTLRDILTRLWTLAWLTFVWVLLWGDITVANVIDGILVALVVTVLLPLPRVPVEGRFHPLSGIRLSVRLALDLCVSSVQVAWLAVRPGPPPLSAVLRVRTEIKSDLVLSLLVNSVNLVPGTLVLEIDRIRRMLYVHVLDVGSDRAVDSFHHDLARLERLFIRAFERDEDWRPSPLHEPVEEE